MKLEELSLRQIQNMYKKKELSPVEYAKNVIECIEEKKNLNAIINLDQASLLKQAKDSEKRIMEGMPRGKLEGIPIGVKDIIDTKDLVTTYGSKAYDKNLPEKDAFVIQQLKKAGASIAIKCNTCQFAMGPTGEVSYDGPVKNPRNEDYISGGSSSGSASSVGGYILPAAIGTDSGGSIRLPSSLCGLVGMKPTFSLVSNVGVMPVSESVDCVGPIARNVWDAAILLETISGYNNRDWRSAPLPPINLTRDLDGSVKGMKVLMLENLLEGSIMPEVVSGFMSGIEKLKMLGVEVVEKRLPDISKYRKAHQLNMMSSAHYVHQDDISKYRKYMYEEVYERLMSGKIDSNRCFEYEMMKNSFREILFDIMGDATCLVYPTTPMLACKIGEGKKEQVVNGIKTSSFKNNGAYTWMASFAGFPSITLPVDLRENNLPVGISLTGRPFDEANLLKIANNLQRLFSI